MKRINLGCGNRPMKDMINVDWDESCNPDIVANLDEKLPFEDNSIDYVYSSHVIEHIKDVFHFMYEIWRICKNGAKVDIIAPNCTDIYGSIMPDHVRFIRLRYFEYWEPKEKTINPTENYSKVTKGAIFNTIQEGTLDELRQLFFKLEVIK